jgi:hypothetical protein
MTGRTRRLVLLATAATVVVVALAGCSGGDAGGGSGPAASPSPPTSAGPAPPAGSTLAPGLYDLEDGTVRAVGTVEHRDLEGGFWAVIGGTEAEGDAGRIVAVIANGADFEQQFRANEGLSVIVTGKRLEGASIRMAGPEIEATGVVAASAAGPAE